MKIRSDAQRLRAKAHTQVQVEEAYQSERNELRKAGVVVPQSEGALSRHELDNLSSAMRKMGLNSGFLKRDGNRLVEVNDPHETDRIREALR